ncbi:MAG: hypothetical protein NT099_03820 [Candidatus Saganbacteria bacterium]|nr:hypothetical protein [Candidatus Saganbacteria bacterium]
MFNKKIIVLSLLALCLVTFVFGATASAQTKVIKKVINKTITPDINPVENAETPAKPSETTPVLSAPPPPPPVQDVNPTTKNKGLWGWEKNVDFDGMYLANIRGQNGLLGVVAAKGSLVFDDPFKFGSKIGLAEDAVEYNLGLGLALGQDTSNNQIFSIPFSAGAKLYLKEGSFATLDPYVGAGLNYNLFGTNSAIGGWGLQLYAGVLADLGWGPEKTGISFGYNAFRVTDQRLAEGVYIGITQPFKL